MRLGRVLMGTFYLTAGLGHFVATRMYMRVMPDYMPAHRTLVLISGVAEMAGGAGVLLPRTRPVAAWGIACLLVSISPANLWMAQHPERYAPIPAWALWLRVPLQLPLIWWALQYTRPDEPKRIA